MIPKLVYSMVLVMLLDLTFCTRECALVCAFCLLVSHYSETGMDLDVSIKVASKSKPLSCTGHNRVCMGLAG